MKKYKRNELGLLEGIEYKFRPDGSIDWRAMVPPEHTYVNQSWFTEKNKAVPRTTEGLRDAQLLIKLPAFKELARIRGFKSLKIEIIKSDLEHVIAKCSIDWIPNFESFGEPVHYEGVANATLYNTSGFGQKFLEAIAENRALTRCVRNFLNIDVVGWEEVDPNLNSKEPYDPMGRNQQDRSSHGPHSTLQKTFSLSDSEDDFDLFKSIINGFIKDGSYKSSSFPEWDSWESIPKAEIRKLIKLNKNV